MPLEMCKKLFSEKKYSELAEYCQKQGAMNPAESMYTFYEAIGLIYLHRRDDARALLERLYERASRCTKPSWP